MTAHALMCADRPTFYRLVAKADDRHRDEWVRAWIMQQQAGGTRRHACHRSRARLIKAVHKIGMIEGKLEWTL